jgi:hypothetical protein
MDSNTKMIIMILLVIFIILYIFSGDIVKQYEILQMRIRYVYNKYIGRLFIGGGY